MSDEILTISKISLSRLFYHLREANLSMSMISSRLMIPMTTIGIQATWMGLRRNGNKSREKDQQQMNLRHAHSYTHILNEINHLLRVIVRYNEVL